MSPAPSSDGEKGHWQSWRGVAGARTWRTCRTGAVQALAPVSQAGNTGVLGAPAGDEGSAESNRLSATLPGPSALVRLRQRACAHGAYTTPAPPPTAPPR